MYVSDRLVITLRSGAGNQFKILKTLPAGTDLEVKSGDENDEWIMVAVPDGTEGYVQTQFLSAEPIAKNKLTVAEKRITQLQSENAGLKEQLQNLTKDKSETDKNWQALMAESEKNKKELEQVKEISAKPLAVAEDNKTLKTQTVALEKETEMLRQENQVLKDRSSRDWFLAGSGVMLVGLLLGLIITKIRWTKKSSWGDGF